MATIIKNKMRSGAMTTTAATEPLVKWPLRSYTITVQQTGLIESIESNESFSKVQSIQMGFQGDHNATRLWVNPWNTSVDNLKKNYEAVMVFISTINNSSLTLTMTPTTDRYYVDVPKNITQPGGEYQLHFILREKITTAEANESAVGEQDDPAYREVFVSAPFLGSVSESSGYKYLGSEFDFTTEIYDYNSGTIYIEASEWDKDASGRRCEVQVFLAGLMDGSSVDDIEVKLPEEATLVNDPSLGSGDATRVLTIIVNVNSEVAAEDIPSVLESITVTYPVQFSASKNKALKLPIIVEHTYNKIAVSGNPNLGMLHDAYVTPIDVSGLISISQSSTTDKYIIFHKDESTCVCKADEQSCCWIPLSITSQAGSWNVSFVAKQGENIYYTDVLTLPVISNMLIAQDIFSDSVYAVIQDSTGAYLLDKNDMMINVLSEGSQSNTASIGFVASDIEAAIGWVRTLQGDNEDNKSINPLDVIASTNWVKEISTSYPAAQVVNQLQKVDQLEQDLKNADVTKLQQDINTINGKVENLIQSDFGTKIDQLDESVTNLNERIDSLEATALEEQIQTNANAIKGLQDTQSELTKSLGGLNTQVSSINTTVDNIKNTTIPELESAYKAADEGLSERINDATDLISNNATNIQAHNRRLSQLETDQRNIEIAVEQKVDISEYNANNSLITSLIDTEKTARINEDVSINLRINNLSSDLNSMIESEIEGRQAGDEALNTAINQHTEEIEAIVSDIDGLTSQISTNKDNISANTTEVNSLKTRTTELETKTEDLNKASVKSTYVAKIIFCSQEEYDNWLANDSLEENTLYLIQEEE